jgi:ABC-type Zn uptake system ZnuABC Zn-binding protein ZnuA
MFSRSRQLLATFTLLLFAHLLAAQTTKVAKPLVVSSASIFADIASAIGDTLIESVAIVPIGGDPHIYEPTPGDVQLLNKGDLILQNGLTFEGWISDLIKNSGTKASIVTITDGIEPIRSEMHQNAVDPHAWMDPVNGKTYALNIKNALVQLMPEHAHALETRYGWYITQLDALDRYIRNAISKIDTQHRILITSHDAFQYYGRRYGLRLESVLGTSTDADVKTSDLMRLNEVIRNTKIPAVFVESTINPKLINQVASDNNIVIGGKLYSDSLGDKASPAGTYLDMIRHNTDVIVQGLTNTTSQQEEKSGSGSPVIIIISIVFLVLVLGVFIWRKRSA